MSDSATIDSGATQDAGRSGGARILLDGVTKRYDAKSAAAVDNVTLEIPAGEIVMLVGPSGCGKTTTMKMINRIIEPTSGRIVLDGEDVTKVNPDQLRRRIGYVIQQVGLFPHQTIGENVAVVPGLLRWSRERISERTDELLELVGLPPGEYRDRYPNELSGGERQRVGVARALAADPPVMLMDEPFSAVDPVVRGQLQDEFLRLQGELGKTIVMVTHDIDEAIKLGDHVAVLRTGGVLAQMATPRDLLASPADAFVADFLGKDRGYRSLSFVDSSGVEVSDVPTVPAGAAPESSADWRLVVDADKRPQGWIAPDSSVVPGGSLYEVGAPIRGALDAALSSPSGLGVAVDAEGRLAGVVTARQVLDVIESRRG